MMGRTPIALLDASDPVHPIMLRYECGRESACCGKFKGDCHNGAVPRQCTIKCATEYVPFWTECGNILEMVMYHAGTKHKDPPGHGRRLQASAPTVKVGVLKSKKSCKALHWGKGYGSSAVCAESDLAHDGVNLIGPGTCKDTTVKYLHDVKIRGKPYYVTGCPWKGKHMVYNCRFRSVRQHCRMSCKLCSNKPGAKCHGNIGKQKTISVTKGFTHASRICKDLGARLCTAQELKDKEAKGTGCGHDNVQTWSSTPCDGQKGYLSMKGDGSGDPVCNGDDRGKRIGGGLSADLAVRCCADADVPPTPKQTGIAPWRALEQKCTHIDSTKLLFAVKDLVSQGCHSKELTDDCSDGWILAGSGVCFSAGGNDVKDDGFGRFYLPVPTSAVKLVHTAGGVSCNYGSRKFYSMWGCDRAKNSVIGTVITSGCDNVNVKCGHK